MTRFSRAYLAKVGTGFAKEDMRQQKDRASKRFHLNAGCSRAYLAKVGTGFEKKDMRQQKDRASKRFHLNAGCSGYCSSYESNRAYAYFPQLLSVLTIAFFLIGVGSAKAGDVYGLIIGINDYIGTHNDLEGAVNDANDIYDVLQNAGAKKIVRLLDGDATRNNIQSTWESFVKNAKAGDTIIFTYSGHGDQEAEPKERGGEDDGKNENFLLAKFSPEGEGLKERIVDDEIFAWLKQADDKGIQVIFVADSCHSGTMHRATRGKIRFRKGKFRDIIDDDFNYPVVETAKLTEKDYKNVTFVGATSDDRLTPEIEIEGKQRGALSWAFARALEGFADRNKDGAVSQLELLGYLVPAVHAHVENQQTPQVLPISGTARPLFNVKRVTKNKKPIEPATLLGKRREADFGRLRVAVEDGPDTALKGLKVIDIVENKIDAELIWNVKEGRVEHSIGGMVAEGVTEATVRQVLIKWASLKWLKVQMARNPVNMTLPNGNQRYKKGDVVEVQISSVRYPYFTLFNLPPNGRIEFYTPAPERAGEAQKNWRGKMFRQKFRVDKPPFGAEHLVAIFSNEVLSDLHAALAAMKSADHSAALRSVLEQSLAGREFQTGVLSIYTGNE